jgi:hypothetical protein
VNMQLTKLNKYTPTNAEQKLLDVMLDPNNRLLNVTDTCTLAEISRKTYYDSFKRQEFVDLVHTTSLELVKQHAIELVMIGLRYAREGSSQHWKVLMEMGKLYNEKRALEQEDNVIVSVRFVGPDDED